ncbi:hypothetical protein [Dietzia sp. WMMA184]|uniref:hypothetical protein n=1 Tax=Dietzia sp. WMMA184 TaxID=2039808 RepID=UPI000BDE7ED4|nr:hypothetical protein [Dietzia sp. WMMA184]
MATPERVAAIFAAAGLDLPADPEAFARFVIAHYDAELAEARAGLITLSPRHQATIEAVVG